MQHRSGSVYDIRVLPILALLLVFANFANAAPVEMYGSIVSVQDGDTLTALVDRKPTKVRLLDIDAPESKQAFGSRSKQSLSELCQGKAAVIITSSKDRYGRPLANVWCGGLHVNPEQVRRGMAWVYDQYVKDRSLYQLQDEARSVKRGLWADPKSIPPWDWRTTTKRENSVLHNAGVHGFLFNSDLERMIRW